MTHRTPDYRDLLKRYQKPITQMIKIDGFKKNSCSIGVIFYQSFSSGIIINKNYAGNIE